jgi:hypothetical protein
LISLVSAHPVKAVVAAEEGEDSVEVLVVMAAEAAVVDMVEDTDKSRGRLKGAFFISLPFMTAKTSVLPFVFRNLF